MAETPAQAPLLSRVRLLAHSALSIVDQAWLSALNLALGLVLIRFTTKADYGLYAQLYVAGLFAISMTDSLIVTPLNTLAPRLSPTQRNAFVGHLGRYHRHCALLLALLFGLACGALLSRQDQPDAMAVAATFAAYVLSAALREFQRGLGFVRGQPALVLRTDIVFGLVLIVGIGALVMSRQLRLIPVLAVLTAANGLAWIIMPRLPQPRRAGYQAAVTDAWRRGRLGLPGALASWIANYSYLYLAAAMLGVAAAADLNASRLLLMPISLLVVAWSRVACPQISLSIAQRDTRHLAQLLTASVTALLLLSLMYLGVLWGLLPWLQRTLLGPEYQGIETLILPWGIYFVLYALHLVGSAVLISADRYGLLLIAAISSLPVLGIALVILLPYLGSQGAIVALIAMECYNILLLFGWFLPAVWRKLPPLRPPAV